MFYSSYHGQVRSKKMRVDVVEHLEETLLLAHARTNAQDEGIGEELFGAGSLVGVFFEASVKEVAHV